MSSLVAQLPMLARLAIANKVRRILIIESFINEWTYHQDLLTLGKKIIP
jgi:hypothetical protein